MTASAASLLLHRLTEVDRKLGATYYNGAFSKEPELEGRAVTFMCFLENVFGHFYEWKTRIHDYCEIPATYVDDWRNFYNALEKSIQDRQPFNGICPVMHITTEWQDRGKTLVVTDMGLRPCAIDKSFFRVALRMIAQNLRLRDSRLVIKIFGIRSQFVQTVVDETNVKPAESKEDRAGRQASVYVFTYDAKQIERLRDQPSIRTWAAPLANELNSRGPWSETKTALVRRMIEKAGSLFKDILDKTSDTTYILPDPLCLREKDLLVFKYGSQILYCPQVELESFIDDEDADEPSSAMKDDTTESNNADEYSGSTTQPSQNDNDGQMDSENYDNSQSNDNTAVGSGNARNPVNVFKPQRTLQPVNSTRQETKAYSNIDPYAGFSSNQDKAQPDDEPEPEF